MNCKDEVYGVPDVYCIFMKQVKQDFFEELADAGDFYNLPKTRKVDSLIQSYDLSRDKQSKMLEHSNHYLVQ